MPSPKIAPEAGMNDYLSKPYSEAQLYAIVAKWVAPSALIAPDKVSSAELAALAPTAQDSILDESVLAPLRSKRPDLLARIIKMYLTHAPVALADMAAAAAEGDCERMARQAHSLKSSSANLGAMQLSALCRELEATANKKASVAAQNLAARIKTGFDGVHRALDAEMAALTAAARVGGTTSSGTG
jgi:HPt (histidine-containing phosphotransfer) domain-containing protein